MRLTFSFLGRLGAALWLAGIALAAQAGVLIEHWLAPSGARVYFVESRALPIVDVHVGFAAGSAYDPPGRAGLAQLTAGLLDQGAGDWDEHQIAERLADLGAVLGGGAEHDRASVSLRTLAGREQREPALELLAAVLSAPRFPEPVFAREKARTVAGLKEALTRPETLASRAFWQALYGDHPYGRQAEPQGIERLTRSDVVDFHRRHYTAARAVVTVVGDLSRAEAEAIAARLTERLPRGEASPPLPDPAARPAAELRIEHPAAQAHVLLGLPTLRRGDPDFYPLLVGNYTLGGGGFNSRLMKEVRDARGFAYSVYSYFSPMQVAGPFQIGLQTKRGQAADALAVTRRVLSGFLAEGPTAEELEAAKQNLIGSFPLRIDSNRKIVDNVAMIGFYGLPLDYLDTWAERIRQVTAADVRAAFARHLGGGALATVLVAAD